ncbi:MAG TPA: hypothetical protein VN450_05370, partial [Candidatus Methylomirabilis sp.]|nr:hypothetical protein [Candidatus Methylomirabilis sp.]
MTIRKCFLILVGALWALTGSIASAQTPGGPPEGAPGVSTSVSAGYLHEFGAAISGGGDFRVSRAIAAADASGVTGSGSVLGLGLAYDLEEYSFSGPSGMAAFAPWGRIHRIGFSPSLMHPIAPGWRLLVAPTIGVAGEEGADPGDALVYGGVVSASKTFGRDLTLGLGAGAFRQIARWRAFPFLSIRWRINDRWRLSNPLRVGPAGPAGLELAYSPDEHWEAAVGGGYRSYRFRLDEDGAVPGGIGEVRGIPVLARLSRSWRPSGWKADLYMGAALGGKLALEDAGGNGIGSASF